MVMKSDAVINTKGEAKGEWSEGDGKTRNNYMGNLILLHLMHTLD